MWNSIRGVITHIGTETLCLDNSGLEWEIEASLETLSKLPRTGEEVRIFTYLSHKEDHMKLFGFSSMDEKKLFLSLISVSGVGPKGALKILSGIKPEDFIDCLNNEDIDGLSRLPGLGKKTAQKIVLQLRGKLIKEDEIIPSNQEHSELVEALASMGFDKKKAAKVVASLLEKPSLKKLEGAPLEQEIMRLAIVELSTAG